MCEVEEQQTARVDIEGRKRRAVIRVESEETHDHVWERFAYEDLSQEEADEIGFRARQVNLEEPFIRVTTDAAKRASDTLRLHQR